MAGQQRRRRREGVLHDVAVLSSIRASLTGSAAKQQAPPKRIKQRDDVLDAADRLSSVAARESGYRWDILPLLNRGCVATAPRTVRQVCSTQGHPAAARPR